MSELWEPSGGLWRPSRVDRRRYWKSASGGGGSSGPPAPPDVVFGTPVYGGDYANVTSIAMVMTGITSGQPILLFYSTINTDNIPTGITDTFATPYSWANILELSIDAAHVAVVYLGTGGTGTGGTITTTNVLADYPCCTAVPMKGADVTTPVVFGFINEIVIGVGPALGSINSFAGYGCAVYVCSGNPLSSGWTPPFTTSYQAYSGSNYGAIGLLSNLSPPQALPTIGPGKIEALVLVQ